MSKAVKVMVCPGGERFVIDEDNARAKAEALRLGVIEILSAELQKVTGSGAASVTMKDGDRLVMIVSWKGFASASENGWASVSVTPANEKTAAWLVMLAHRLAQATEIRMVEGGAPWN